MSVDWRKKDFVRKYSRMCRAFPACVGCPLRINAGCLMEHAETEADYEQAVELVERWTDENPENWTILDDFSKKYPDAVCDNGIPVICPRDLGYADDSEPCPGDCAQCWNMLMEDGYDAK